MPLLPEGWHYELHSSDMDVVHVVWPEHGAVSVHFKRRTFEGGWTIPKSAPYGAERQGGRGWKDALVNDAVAHLKAAWN